MGGRDHILFGSRDDPAAVYRQKSKELPLHYTNITEQTSRISYLTCIACGCYIPQSSVKCFSATAKSAGTHGLYFS